MRRLWIAAALAGCGSSELGFPMPRDAASALIAIEEGGGTRAEIREVVTSVERVVSADRVFVLFYAERPAELGLEEGPIELDVAGRDCRLLAPVAVFLGSLEEAPQATAAPSGFLERLVPDRASACPGCTSFHDRRVPLLESGPITEEEIRGTFAGSLSDGSVLAGLLPAGLRQITPDRTVEVTGCPGPRFEVAWSAGADRFWLGRIGGEVVEARIDPAAHRCELIASMTLPKAADGDFALAVAGDPTGDDLYAATFLGQVVQRREQGFEVLFDLGPVAEGHVSNAGLAWLGPGKIAFGFAARGIFSAEVRFFDETNGVSSEPVSHLLELDDNLSTLANLPRVGLVFGSDRGVLARRLGESWIAIESPIREQVGVFLPFRGGFVATWQGATVQFLPDLRSCPRQELLGTADVSRNGTPIANGVFLPDVVYPSDKIGPRLEGIFLTAE